MPRDGKQIDNPPLRATWKKAKDDAEKAAAKSPADKEAFKKLDKSFKADLGPQLDKWMSDWPDFQKITKAKNALDVVLASYAKSVKDAGLSKKITDDLTTSLKEIGNALDSRLGEAEIAIASDESLALKESTKKQVTPITLFRKTNVAKQVMAKAKKADAKFDLENLEIGIVLSDKDVLAAAPSSDKDYSYLAQQMYDAADYGKILQEIADALDQIADKVGPDSDMGKVNAVFDKMLAKILDDAVDRANKVFIAATKARVDRRKYVVSQTFKMIGNVAGLVGGAFALATTPFTAGASSVLGIVAIMQGARSLGLQLGSLAQSAEEAAGELAKNLGQLADRYKQASANRVGAEELGRTLANAVWPEATKSISGCKSKADTVSDKISGLKVNVLDLSDKLDEALKKQDSGQKELAKFERSAKDLDKKDIARIEKLMASVDKVAKPIQDTIDNIISLDERIKKASASFDKLKSAVDELAKKEPTWAQIGEVVINVSVAAGFLVGGSVNAPDPFKLYDTARKVTDNIGIAMTSLQTVAQSVSDVKSIVDEAKKKG